VIIRGLKLVMARGSAKKRTGGPILLERQRRKHDNVPILQRAMELKKKKNLEPVKGNHFTSLHPDMLNQMAIDVNLKFGENSDEANFIINNLVTIEQDAYDSFVKENP
jgi:hypothetical protein